jgi:hypothetical protein
VFSGEYVWQRSEWHDEEVLAPDTGAIWTEDEQYVFDQGFPKGEWEIRVGRAFARSALRKFVRLGRQLQKERDPLVQRTLIMEYANEFGLLTTDPKEFHSLQGWRHAVTKFLDLYDVSRAYRTANFREFDRHVEVHPYMGDLQWRSFRHDGGIYTIAYAGVERTTELSPGGPVRRIRDIEEAKRGSSYKRALMLLAYQVGQRLAQGMSFKPSWIDPKSFSFEPASLLDLLYVRLWIDTVGFEDLELTTRTCDQCGDPIPEDSSRRKKFCSDQCRWEYNNRRRAALA